MPTVSPIRVALADDAPTIRAIVRFFLAKDSQTEFVGEATNALDIVPVCISVTPMVVLLDLHMPGPPLPTTIQSIHSHDPNIKIIMLTDEQDHKRVREIVPLCVSGYILKADIARHLLVAIHTIAKGGRWYSSAIRAIFMEG